MKRMKDDPWGIQIRIHESETLDARVINIWRRVARGGTVHLEPEGWVPYETGVDWKQPTLTIPGPEIGQVFQQLVDVLKEQGIVPKETREEVSDLQRTIDAKDAHITDLRKILDMWTKPEERP